jgi:hypothetical protein
MSADPPETNGSGAPAGVARAILDAAVEAEAAEARIKDAVLAAARAGDQARVIDLVTRWQHMPAPAVLDPNWTAPTWEP